MHGTADIFTPPVWDVIDVKRCAQTETGLYLCDAKRMRTSTQIPNTKFAHQCINLIGVATGNDKSVTPGTLQQKKITYAMN